MAQRVNLTQLKAAGTAIAPLSIKHPNAAGRGWPTGWPRARAIDIGGANHYVAVPPDRVSSGEHAVREFGPHTEDLNAAADGLTRCRIDTVALESTGV